LTLLFFCSEMTEILQLSKIAGNPHCCDFIRLQS